MEHLALGLVWLLRILASVSLMFQQVHMVKMDMALFSFDDQYQGCSHMMEEELEELNRTEFVPGSNYAKAWKEATAEWQLRGSQSSVLKPEQAIALMTFETPPLYQDFIVAMDQAGHSLEQYLQNFHFKVLHFLLMDAMRALRDAKPGQCYNAYQWVEGFIITAKQGETVRLGPLTSMSLDKTIAEGPRDGTSISVKTCYGVPIREFSFWQKDEVLIPPFETFEVRRVTHEGNSARIELRSTGVYSKYNCEYVKEKRCKNQPCDFSAGQSVSHHPLWGFILAATALATAVGI